MTDFRSRRDYRRRRVCSNSSTFATAAPPSDAVPTYFSFTPTVVSPSPSFGLSSSSSSTLVPSASENPSSVGFGFTASSQLFSSPRQIGSFSSSPSSSFLSRDFTIPATTIATTTTTTVGIPDSSSTCSISVAKYTVHAPTAYPSSGSVSHIARLIVPPANDSARSVGSCASYVLNEAPTSIASAASDLLTSMTENAENVVNEGHFPPAEEHQMQKVVEEGEKETKPDPISSQTAIPSNESAVPHFDTISSVETFREEVKEMQKSAAEDSCVSELSMDFNLLTDGSRILRGILQSPHFCSLPDYPGRVRKNLISGWDKTFEETYDQIQSLKASDFWNSKYELELTLDELESMGYNVTCLRKRFHELTNLMKKRESALFAMWSLRIKMESHNREKHRLEGKIYNLQIQAGKEQASINGLLDEVAKLEESLPVVDSLFASLVASPL